MLLYICVLLSVVVAAFLLNKTQRVKYIIPFICLLAVSALRSENMGIDNNNYIEYYWNNCQTLSWITALQQKDGFFYILNKVVHLFTNDFHMFMAITSFIFLLGVFVFIKQNCRECWLSVWLFITMGFFQTNFTTIRMSVALGISLIAISFALKKKLIPFLIAVFAAFMFHASAAVVIIIYPLLQWKIRKWHIYILISLLASVFLLRQQLFNLLWKLSKDRYEYHMDDIGTEAGGEKLLAVYIMIMLFVVICTFQVKSHVYETNEQLSRLILWCSGIVVAIQSFVTILPIMYRLGNYFSLPLFLLLPNLIDDKFRERDRRLVILGIMALSFMFYIRYLIVEAGVLHSSVPYEIYPFWEKL
ncbi:MAG: EpsG family protein [Bacteroidales bacterium]|nr:EpsG family protein [Lachnoclostridium sp.]MCM1384731.1 EpsG family protein [Lachnoclostridium sp.]MCM1465255.1 EpsG family protein [Bacteroidales bacterium]